MNFEIVNKTIGGVILAGMTTLNSFMPSPTPVPTPAPIVKSIVEKPMPTLAPQVTVEKFIGPTLPIVEKKVEVKTEKILLPENVATPEASVVTTKSSPTPIATPTPTPTPINTPPSSQNFDLIWNMINEHRNKIGLPAFEKDERLCKIAQNRGPQLHNEIFGDGIMHQGMKDLNLPYWNTENIVAYESEQRNFDWWMSDDIHRRAIESNNKYSCGTCFGNACVQEFSSFIPK